MSLTINCLLTCLRRSYVIGALNNTKGMQNIGVLYAMDPGLQELYKDERLLLQARQRYLEYINTYPFMTPFLIGYFLFLEVEIARGLLGSDTLNKIKKTTTNTLSAIGDSFFSGSLLLFWSLISIILLLSGHILLVWLWLFLFLFSLQIIKLTTFWIGWKQGLAFLQKLKQIDLINWGRRIKQFNALVLAFIWLMVFPYAGCYWLFGLSSIVLGFAAWICYKRFVLREILVASIMLVFISFYLIYG